MCCQDDYAFAEQSELDYQDGWDSAMEEIREPLIEIQTEVKQQLGKRLPITKEDDTSDFAALVRIHHKLIELVGP